MKPRQTLRAAIAACALWAALSAGAAIAAHQTPAPTLSGVWLLNVEQSDRLPVELAPSSGGNPRMRRGSGGTASSERAERAGEVRAILEEAALVPNRLTIDATTAGVLFTGENGLSRKFVTDGKKHPVKFGLWDVDAKAAWDRSALIIELTAKDIRLTERWDVAIGNTMMLATFTLEGRAARDSEIASRRVYDRRPGLISTETGTTGPGLPQGDALRSPGPVVPVSVEMRPGLLISGAGR